MIKRGNYILVDFCANNEWLFVKSLAIASKLPWVVISKVSNTFHGSVFSNFRRFFCFFFFPLSLVIQGVEKGSVLLAWQQFYGLNLAFWYRLFRIKKKHKLIVMTFIYKEKNGFVGKIYHMYMQFVVNSIYIDRYICFSSKECGYYKKLFNNDSFVYVPLGVPTIDICPSIQTNKKYIFSTGRSNRDYDFLVSTLYNLNYELHIACDNLSNYTSKGNVFIHRNMFSDDMIRCMNDAFCVVIILRDPNISAGQLVILQAMQLGKPVIVTKSNGICDYIEDGITGLLINNNKDELLVALHRLYNDTELYRQLSINARKAFVANHSIDVMGENVAKVVKGVV